MLADQHTETPPIEEGLPRFAAAGDRAPGAYACADCGYGVTVRRELPRCPMCSGVVWEQLPARAFSDAPV